MAAAVVSAVSQWPVRPSTSESNIEGRIDLISSSPLFAGLPQQALDKIARLARPKAIGRDEVLFMQGQPARVVALIRAGSIKISQLSSSGNEVILWIYGAGAVLGTLTDPISCCYTSSARALEASTALVWEHETLLDLMKEYPQIRMNASQILAIRLNELEERFREVATEKVAKRVAFALLRLLKHVGKKVNGGVEVSLSREELAQMTGTTLFTISRLISKWGEMGYVLPRRESVIVRDNHMLGMSEDDDIENEARPSRGEQNTGRAQLHSMRMYGSSRVNNGVRKPSEAVC